MLNKVKISLLIILLALVVDISFAQNGKSKNVNSTGVSMNFIQDRTKLKANELASNVLKITNNTNRNLDLILQISSPAGWKLFNKKSTQISIKANDSLFIPVRVSPAYELKGNTNYVVNAFLSTESFTITNTIWYVAVEKISSWQAKPSSNKLYFAEGSDTVSFSIEISNFGNADEILDVLTTLDKDLYFINSLGEPVNLNSRPVIVGYNRDTVLYYTVKRIAAVKLPTEGEPDPGSKPISYLIKLKIVNEKTGAKGFKSWTSALELKKLPDEVYLVQSGLGALPVTVDFNTYDLLSGSTYASLNLYGIKRFNDNSNLTYYYQGSFVQNELEAKSFLGNYHYIGYFHRLFSLEAGDIGANKSGSTLSGKGVKGMLYLKNNKIGALYIRRPDLFNNVYLQGYGVSHNFGSSFLSTESFYQHSDYIEKKITSDYGLTDIGFKLFKIHNFKIGFGYSNENHAWLANDIKNINGYGYNIAYSVYFKKFNGAVRYQSATPNYTPKRGVNTINSILTYRFNPKYTLSLQYMKNDNSPEFYLNGELQSFSIFNKQTHYMLKFVYNAKRHTFVFNPTYYTLNTNLLNAQTIGHNLEYRMKSKGRFKANSSIFTGYTKFPEHKDIDPIFIAYAKFSLSYNLLQFNVRYQYGPYYSMEQTQYILNQINPQKWYSTFYYDYWFYKNMFRLNTNFNYIYTTANKKHQFSTRPELYYYSKSGVVMSLYTRYLFYADGEHLRTVNHVGSNPTSELVEATSSSRFEFGTGIKFNVNVPIVPSKNYDVKIIAFRDLNGNGVKDPNEKGIENMLIRMHVNDTMNPQISTLNEYGETKEVEWELISNIDGNVFFNKVPLGDYIITAMPLTSMGGWFDGKTFYRHIAKDQIIYIPLSKGARVSGGILIERDRLTDNKPIDLGSIRVTAQGVNDNKVFTTLTAEDGTFTLYVPNGDYIIFINEAAVGEKWEFMQNNIPLTVEEDFENYNVSFYLMEKKRTIKSSNAKLDPTQAGKQQKPLTLNDLRVNNGNQKTQLQDPDFLNVVEPKEEGKQWVIQLFPNEGPRMYVKDFDTLRGIINTRCVVGQNNGFLYISESFDKKKAAKKVLENVKERGYKDAQIIEFVFGNKVQATTIVTDPKPVLVDTNTTKNNNIVTEPIVNTTPAGISVKSISTEEEKAAYRVEIKVSSEKMSAEDLSKIVPQETEVYEIQIDGLWKYSVGNYTSYNEAKEYQKKIQKLYKLADSFVTQYKDAW